MLKRPSRLPREGFEQVTRGRRLVAPHFSISYTPGGGQAAAVVSKKVAKTSVARHLLKRRLLALAQPHVGARHSFIIYARAGAPALSYAAIRKELEPLFVTLRV